MRRLAVTLSIAAAVALVGANVASGFVPGFAAGVGYMLAAALVINSQQREA